MHASVVIEGNVSLIKQIIVVAAKQKTVIMIQCFHDMCTVAKRLDMRSDQKMRHVDAAYGTAMSEFIHQGIFVKRMNRFGHIAIFRYAAARDDRQYVLQIIIRYDVGFFVAVCCSFIDRKQLIRINGG